jgi:hypothetical protein
MKDELFIEQKLQKGQQAKEKVEDQLSGLSHIQLNWKPSSDQWSIAECLEHLLVSDRSYFSDLNKITGGTYKMSFWERYSPLTSLWGKIFISQLQETVKIKMTAPRKLTPSVSDKPTGFVSTYLSNYDSFLNLIAHCKKIDIDKTIITSPAIKIVTYSLRDAFEFLINHEHRHINQAIRVKDNTEFPKI